MKALAVIPARGGSKGLPRKNVRIFCGKPLVAWTIEAALAAQTVRKVVVSTDDAEIARESLRHNAEVVWRPADISSDTSSSEEALLHVLRQLRVEQGVLAFLQCTSPLMLPEDIDGVVKALQHADSAFTATPWHHFAWKESGDGAVPLGHSKEFRPMRQQKEAQFLEVGAAYAMDVAGFLQAEHRFFGRVAMHLIPPERSIEIDSEADFIMGEALMRYRLHQNNAAQLMPRPAALVMDFDGVLTDNRVCVDEAGHESVVCHRGDGWAIRKIKAAGIATVVLTNEENASVKQRCAKLGVECIVAQQKLPALREWLGHRHISPESVLYVGNDDPDVLCMQYVGCSLAPADASPKAINAAQVVLVTPGGHGCIRELAGMLWFD